MPHEVTLPYPMTKLANEAERDDYDLALKSFEECRHVNKDNGAECLRPKGHKKHTSDDQTFDHMGFLPGTKTEVFWTEA